MQSIPLPEDPTSITFSGVSFPGWIPMLVMVVLALFAANVVSEMAKNWVNGWWFKKNGIERRNGNGEGYVFAEFVKISNEIVANLKALSIKQDEEIEQHGLMIAGQEKVLRVLETQTRSLANLAESSTCSISGQPILPTLKSIETTVKKIDSRVP